MQIGTINSFHLTYCTNIHPGESWLEVFANLQQYLPPLKAQLSPHAPFGVGLRLSAIAASELLMDDRLAHFQHWLSQQDLYVFTLNGFPYGGFHHQRVKDKVYTPDWTTHERLDYTLQLLDILAALLPCGMEGSISTLPLSYKPWWTDNPSVRSTHSEAYLEACCKQLAIATATMMQIHTQTGKLLHLNLEPEPDGAIENTDDVLHFFQDWLLPCGGTYLASQLHLSQARAEALLLDHIRICYDTCHFAVAYEDPKVAFMQLQSAGIQIGKIQISAALQVELPEGDRALIHETLSPFAESTYLHQVVERWADGTLYHYPDLITALPELVRSPAQEWRIHFHVPIFSQDYQLLQSTQADIIRVLELLPSHCPCQHLEIETYTWQVLPPELKLDVLTSIQREYEWVLTSLNCPTSFARVESQC